MRYKLPGFKAGGRRQRSSILRMCGAEAEEKNNPKSKIQNPKSLNRTSLNWEPLYKVTEAGGFYIEVPCHILKPSQTCPNCGHQKKKELSERIHSCQKCSYTCDRDVAAAMVMLQDARGKELTSSDVESPSSTLCGSMRQLGAKKRQKLVPNASLGWVVHVFDTDSYSCKIFKRCFVDS